MRLRTGVGLAVACLTLAPSFATAQSGRPDPATVRTPDVSPPSDPKIVENGFRYHYLHKPGVTYAQAYDDFAICERFAWNGLFAATPVPGFAPWPTTAGADEPIGDLDWARVAGVVNWAKNGNARARRANGLWRCMKPRGYRRYAISEATWLLIYDPKQGGSLAVEAKLASGPTPSSAPVTE